MNRLILCSCIIKEIKNNTAIPVFPGAIDIYVEIAISGPTMFSPAGTASLYWDSQLGILAFWLVVG